MREFSQHFPVLSVMGLFLAAFLVEIVGKNKYVRYAITLISVLAATFMTFYLILPVFVDGEIITYWMGGWKPEGGYAFGIGYEIDGLGLFFGLLVVLTVLFSALFSWRYMERDSHLPHYYTLFLMLSGSVLGLVFTGDVFNLFIMIEIMTFAAVALTAFRHHRHAEAVEGAFKYLVIGSIGSSVTLLGVALLYLTTHTLNMAQISALVRSQGMQPTTLLSLGLMIAGFGIKSFIVPFHTPAADAYATAPASISMVFSGMVNKAGVYGIIRLLYTLFRSMDKQALQMLLVVFGAVTMFVGVTMALAQHDFKRLLAFHSISQIGYVLTAVGLGTVFGLYGGLFHALNHTLFKGLLFLTAGAVYYATGSTNLDGLGGLAKKMPRTTVCFLVGAFAISGIPPFNGFASKWLIYQAAYQKGVESGNIGFLLVTICCLVTSTLTLASFVKVTQSVFFGQLPKEYENVREVSFGMRLAMGLLALLCIVTGLFPGLVTTFLTEPAARAVFGANHYINAMMGAGYAESFGLADALPVSFYSAGVWSPISWLCLLMIMLLAVAIVAVSSKYDQVSALAKTAAAAEAAAAAGPRYGSGSLAEGKYELFFGGEESVYSQVGGDDMFWGFKHNWRHYFSFMHNLHSGIVNDYALWAVIALALAMLYAMIIL